MLSIKINEDKLELKIEGSPPIDEFKATINILKEMPGRFYNATAYTWSLPKDQIDELISKMNGVTRLIWLTPLSRIKGIKKKAVLPDFEVSDKYLDELLLTPYPFQTVGISFLHDVKQCMIADEMGLGKAQPLTAKILTPTGWKTMGDIKVGDKIINSSGTESNVLGVYPQGEKDTYKVTFSDGSSTECCSEHLWNVNTEERRQKGLPSETLSLDSIITNRNNCDNLQYYIPIVKPVQFPYKPLPMDPYLIGAALSSRFLKVNGHDDYGKYITDDFKFATKMDRLQLLRGIVGSDIDRCSECLNYQTVSERFAHDIIEVVQSLGGIARIRTKVDIRKRNGAMKEETFYRLSISLPSEIVSGGHTPSRFIESIEYVGLKQAQCIYVDSDDHLYVTDNYILTHNTVQIVGAVWRLHREGKVDKALIICPASLKYQWANEIEKFLGPDVKAVVVNGTEKQRAKVYEEISSNPPLFTIMNYELMRNDIATLVEMGWDCIACDEIHRAKSSKTQTNKSLSQLDAPYKFGATGTPMQNKPEEIFNVFSWIDSKILGTWSKFSKDHIVLGTKFRKRNVVLGYDNLDELHDKLAKFMLRRLKVEVAPELPKMLINNYIVPMTNDQIKLHDRINDDLLELMREVGDYTEYDEHGDVIKEHPKAGQILGMFTLLQEVCNTPELLSMSGSGMAKKYAIKNIKSPKLDELENIVKDILANDETAKIVIFSQFERMQGLIEARLSKLGKCTRLSGKMSAIDRQKSINEFTMGDAQFFLASDAGNYGINLQCAKALIQMDLPWNPAVYDQRNGRIHRIGSTHDAVNIINLISAESLDERILDTMYKKKEYSDIIVEKSEAQAIEVGKLTSTVMKNLLKTKKKKK